MSTDNQYDSMTPAEFEEHLPELFAAGNVSSNPSLQAFLAKNPDCAALVRDLETIAEHAKSLFEPVDDPSDEVWSRIASKLDTQAPPDETLDTTE